MSNYFVAYDLSDPETNKAAVLDRLLAIGRAGELVPSVWYLKTQLDERAVRDHLRTVMQEQDKLLVIATTNAVGFGLDPGLWQAVRDEWNAGFTAAAEPATQDVAKP